MIYKKYRYFIIDNLRRSMETITWGLCGTGNAERFTEAEGISIGHAVVHPATGLVTDCWIPLKVSGPAFNTAMVCTYSMKMENRMIVDPDDPQYGNVVSVPVPDKTLSVNYDYYSIPLKPLYVETTLEGYNDFVPS